VDSPRIQSPGRSVDVNHLVSRIPSYVQMITDFWNKFDGISDLPDTIMDDGAVSPDHSK
jgi:hypothetical protein